MKYLPKKSLGQNFLVNEEILNLIADLGKINSNDIVIEVGPGTGNLTEKILKKKPKKLIVVEKDKNLSLILKKKFSKNVEIINENILNYNQNIYYKKKIIIFGNLPYNISTQILIKFIKIHTWPPFYDKIIFMFQKEVADRILAKSNTKQYGRISVISNFRFNITDNFKISKNCFFPKPKVDSKIIIFKPKVRINYKISNIENLEKITQVFFSNKRKMINKAFSRIFQNYEDVAEKLNINLKSRPSELSYEDYYKLTEHYEKINFL